MKDLKIQHFQNLHSAVRGFGRGIVVYRGLRSLDYELKPKIGRYSKFRSSEFEKEEKTILRLFKEQALPYLDFVPAEAWDWLVLCCINGFTTIDLFHDRLD